MSSKIEVVPYKWNDHACYIGKINYKDLPNLVDIRSDISMNRKIDDKRVNEIKQYIINDIPGTFFPPTILNSKANMSFEKSGSLNVKSGNFTVIDGQHRIKAIITLLDEVKGPQGEQLKLMELPVVIIEDLENYQHRDLFYMINETPKNVESNVSERFAPKLENLLGLKFFSEYKHLTVAIEWHEKQSREKVVYIHMTDCIRELNRILYPTLKDWYVCDRDLIYNEPSYLEIINHYWSKYFELLEIVELKAFFRKKITLRAIIEEVYISIDNVFNIQSFNPSTLRESVDKIKQVIENTLCSLLQDPLIEYQGSESVKKDVFTSIRHFLIINSRLFEYKEQIYNTSKITFLIDNVVKNYYTDNILSLEESDYKLFDITLTSIITNIETLNGLEEEVLTEITLNKQTSEEKILEIAAKG